MKAVTIVEKHSRRVKKRILVVGMLDSIHLARWLQQFENEDLDFLVFASGPHRKVHPLLESLQKNFTVASFELVMNRGLASLIVWMLDRILGCSIRGALLKLTIRRSNPDIVHALELQNAGYSVMQAFKGIEFESRPKLIVTNYGSDIYWFARLPRHQARLRQLLKLADTYSCECHRDAQLARNLGFTGEIMPIFPNAGGFPLQKLKRPVPHLPERNTIAIKGYQGWVGRAAVALRGIEIIAESLQDYDIEIYSCNRVTRKLAAKIQRASGLRITCWQKGALSHDQMSDLFERAVIYVGISESDGISTSLLEAMAAGAIPVQTSTACCDEWFTDTGVRVNTISPDAVAEAILAALELAKNPSNAQTNRKIIAEKASEEKVRDASLSYYR